jgi:hypothetical protein
MGCSVLLSPEFAERGKGYSWVPRCCSTRPFVGAYQSPAAWAGVGRSSELEGIGPEGLELEE